MSYSLLADIDHKISSDIRKKLLLINYQRLAVGIPIMTLFLLLLVLTNGNSFLWGYKAGDYMKINLPVLIIQSVFMIWFFLFKPEKEDDVKGIHRIFVLLNYTLLIVWAALTTGHEYVISKDYIVFLFAMIVGAGINTSRSFYTVILGIAGVGILHLFHAPDIERMQLVDAMIIMITLFILVVFSQMHNRTLIRLFLKDHELEQRVDERTKELEMQTRNAMKSDNLKSIFLANMSHEIRTPLNGIIGFSRLLKDFRDSEEQREQYIEIINTSAKNLLNILNDIIEVSRIEAGECELMLENIDLNAIIEETVSGFLSYDAVVDGSIILEAGGCAGSRPLMIVSDRIKIIQILNNLISNAIKYSRAGRIIISCGINPAGELQLEVEDSGIGIREEDAALIFERFRQAGGCIYGVREGVGLGLTIVKGYTDMLGGRVELESEYGRGSIFRIVLPQTCIAESKGG